MILLKDGAKVKGFAMQIPHSCFLALTKKRRGAALEAKLIGDQKNSSKLSKSTALNFPVSTWVISLSS